MLTDSCEPLNGPTSMPANGSMICPVYVNGVDLVHCKKVSSPTKCADLSALSVRIFWTWPFLGRTVITASICFRGGPSERLPSQGKSLNLRGHSSSEAAGTCQMMSRMSRMDVKQGSSLKNGERDCENTPRVFRWKFRN